MLLLSLGVWLVLGELLWGRARGGFTISSMGARGGCAATGSVLQQLRYSHKSKHSPKSVVSAVQPLLRQQLRYCIAPPLVRVQPLDQLSSSCDTQAFGLRRGGDCEGEAADVRGSPKG